ncbi:hypothetical protein ACFX1X_028871 [Malus domestica]
MENVGSEAIDDGFLMDDEFLMENVDLFLASSIVKLAFAEEKSCDLEHGKMVSIQQSGSLELYASFLILFDLHIVCALAWYFSVTIVDSVGIGTVLCAIVLPKVSYPKKSFGKYVKILPFTAPRNRTFDDVVEVAVSHLKYERPRISTCSVTYALLSGKFQKLML